MSALTEIEADIDSVKDMADRLNHMSETLAAAETGAYSAISVAIHYATYDATYSALHNVVDRSIRGATDEVYIVIEDEI